MNLPALCGSCRRTSVINSSQAELELIVAPDGATTITFTCPVCKARSRTRTERAVDPRTIAVIESTGRPVTKLPERRLPPEGELTADYAIDIYADISRLEGAQ